MHGSPQNTGSQPGSGDADSWRMLSGDALMQANLQDHPQNTFHQQVFLENRQAQHHTLQTVDAAMHLLRAIY